MEVLQDLDSCMFAIYKYPLNRLDGEVCKHEPVCVLAAAAPIKCVKSRIL